MKSVANIISIVIGIISTILAFAGPAFFLAIMTAPLGLIIAVIPKLFATNREMIKNKNYRRTFIIALVLNIIPLIVFMIKYISYKMD